MNEQEKFSQWWESKGVNSVILRAQAWSAWLARAEADQPQPQPEDPDEWVVQDRVPVRIGVDEYRYASWYKDDWRRVAESGNWSGKEYHNWTDRHGDTLEVRCRRRDLPKVEQPEQWPKYWTTDGSDLSGAYVEQPDAQAIVFVFKDGHRQQNSFASIDGRKQLTEAEAMALLDKPASNIDWSYHNQQKPQPKKTMLRLWIDSDCNIHAGLKGDGDLELHYDHETRQFYTEEQS